VRPCRICSVGAHVRGVHGGGHGGWHGSTTTERVTGGLPTTYRCPAMSVSSAGKSSRTPKRCDLHKRRLLPPSPTPRESTSGPTEPVRAGFGTLSVGVGGGRRSPAITTMRDQSSSSHRHDEASRTRNARARRAHARKHDERSPSVASLGESPPTHHHPAKAQEPCPDEGSGIPAPRW
jgi:hypothetical protein